MQVEMYIPLPLDYSLSTEQFCSPFFLARIKTSWTLVVNFTILLGDLILNLSGIHPSRGTEKVRPSMWSEKLRNQMYMGSAT